MKPTGILKPLKTSAAALRNRLCRGISGRYEIVSVLSFPKMLYLVPEAKAEASETGKYSVNIRLFRSEQLYRIAAYFRDISSYNASRKIRRINNLSDNLFRSYTYLNRLTQALWSIYRSNDLRLSRSLLTLIRAINKKNGVELDADLEGLTKIIRFYKRTISVLKSVDHTLFGQLHSRYCNLSVMKIGKHEICRRTDTAARNYEKTVFAFSRLTENIHSMTPLLMRIYEEIETGVYLYSADSYRNAKTLARLTNSLWKVYRGQNMELSRSFSRLITRVNQESKSFELRNAKYDMFSDTLSLKNLVNALRRAFSGSNLELRNSMISLFGDIHKAGSRRNIAVNKHCNVRPFVGIILLHREIVPEYDHIRLDYRKPERLSLPERTGDHSGLERGIKTKLDKLEDASVSVPRSDKTEDIVREVLEKVNRKQQLDWRLEKLQRGIF